MAHGALVATNPMGREPTQLSILTAFLIGLGYRIHLAGFLVAPAVGVAILSGGHASLMRRRFMLACAAAARARAHAIPVRADPRRPVPGAERRRDDRLHDPLRVECTFDAVHVRRVARTTSTRGQYGEPRFTERQAPLARRSGCAGSTSSGNGCATRTGRSRAADRARRRVPRARPRSAAASTGEHDRATFWFFAAAHAHGDARC